MAADAPAILADFGESIVYTPQGQAPRTITAIIERFPLRQDALGGRPVVVNAIELWFPNDPATGLTTVKDGFDRVTLKMNQDDAAARELRVSKIMGDSDAGLWHVEASL